MIEKFLRMPSVFAGDEVRLLEDTHGTQRNVFEISNWRSHQVQAATPCFVLGFCRHDGRRRHLLVLTQEGQPARIRSKPVSLACRNGARRLLRPSNLVGRQWFCVAGSPGGTAQRSASRKRSENGLRRARKPRHV